SRDHLHSFPTRRSSDLEKPNVSNRTESIWSSAAKCNGASLTVDVDDECESHHPYLCMTTHIWEKVCGACQRCKCSNWNIHTHLRSEEHTSELQSRFDLV